MNPLSRAPLPPSIRAKTVTAVLGPTNTGKTHLAIERMLAHKSGLIGLPLRLLAREVYQKIAARAGADQVALITGEEKIIPPNPRYFVSTVEAMPKETDVDFVAIDEVQLAGDLERGHVFTDRILNLRGRGETLLLGAQTVRGLLEKLLPGLNVVTRPRMSQLTYAGSKKITRLPARSAIVAFSADEVYAIAELIRRQRGGAAVVLGALSPRTRNAQVDLFQSGDVDFLIATDAVGMGLNLDVDHVAFAGNRKFDGYQYRNLSAAELGQIAGRAGRHLRDGTFGVTGRVDPFDDELVQALETHQFAPLKVLQWRNPQLDFSSIDALRRSLDRAPAEDGLAKAPPADDVTALEFAARDGDIAPNAKGEALVALLWDVCQVPDYRKIAPANHAELVTTLYDFLVRRGTISDDWFARQVAEADKIDGDIDTLSNRIAHIRTWTFIANRPDWLTDPVHWRDKTRAIEDRLSDALHERLTQRFVDRRTSVLMRRLRENAMLEAEITPAGDVVVEGHRVGHLQGFRFQPDTTAEGPDAKAVRNAASKVLATEFEARADKLSRAGAGEIALAADGTLRWLGETVGKLARADDALRPAVLLLADEQLTGPARDKVQARLDQWVKTHVETLLKPLTDLRDAPDLEGIARGVAFQLVEGLGVLERSQIADEIKSLDQPMRAGLRKYGVRFGAYHVFVPLLLKPAPSGLIALLWSLQHADADPQQIAELHQLSASGRTSIPVDKAMPKALYRLGGFRVCGERAVRIDILERLADIIRPLIAWKPLDPTVTPPEGAVPGGGAFTVTVAMTSLLGCSGEDFASILKSLGYRVEKRKLPKPAPRPVRLEPAAVAAAAHAEAAAAAAAGAEASETTEAATDASEAPAEIVATIEAAPETPVTIEASEATPAAEANAETPAVETEASGEAATPAEEATAEEATATGDAPAEAAGEAAAEPELLEVDVWRPGRFERGDHQHRGPRRDDRRDDRRPPREPNAAQRRASEAPVGDGGRPPREGGRPQGDRPPRGDRPHGERFDRGERRDRPDRGGHGGGHGGGFGGGHGADRRPGNDKPKRPEKPLDPNSPFAALAALKASLEQKQKPEK